jgi:hypothetical protein
MTEYTQKDLEGQPLVPEEQPLSYMDMVGNLLSFMFPKTAFAKERVAEGLISATKPWGYTTDLSRARENREQYGEGGIMDEASIIADKTTRFIRGALGLGGDYTDEVTEALNRRSGKRSTMADIALTSQPDFDITDIVKTGEDIHKRARTVAEARTDLLALGLGRPQRYGHLVESQHRPSIGETDPTSEYLDFKEGSGFKEKGLPPQHGSIRGADMRRYVLANYKKDLSDEYDDQGRPKYESYYDRWDFAGKDALGKLNEIIEDLGLYKPREIYGRIP